MKNFLRALTNLCLILSLCLPAFPAQADRIKDVAGFAGVRGNQLIGVGLVVGLDSSGDQTSQAPFTVQALKNLLAQLGLVVPPGVSPQLRNVAAVSVHAELPAFAKPGQQIDVTVSSIGNARSLRGGSLLVTTLKGLDGQVYAIAQGNLVVGGFGVDANDGSSISVNIPSAGRIPNGATVERSVPTDFGSRPNMMLNLHAGDFSTATRVAQRINTEMGAGSAWPVDAISVEVRAPQDPAQRVTYLSMIENLEFTPAEAPARIIINSRTGTVVIGANVRVSPAAVSHGSLVVTISEDYNVSQPGPFSPGGQTVVTPQSNIEITEDGGHMFLFNPDVSLDSIVRAVNEVGAAPGDLVAILEALKQSGSLHAELIVI